MDDDVDFNWNDFEFVDSGYEVDSGEDIEKKMMMTTTQKVGMIFTLLMLIFWKKQFGTVRSISHLKIQIQKDTRTKQNSDPKSLERLIHFTRDLR
ncbi:hypothetical protein OROGR_011180 [Orobanche gracilis]